MKASYQGTSQHRFLTRLRQLLVAHFDKEELRTLCSDLGVDYDDLRGEGKTGQARELVAYLERRGRIPELVAIAQRLRPHVPWEEMPSATMPAPTTPGRCGEVVSSTIPYYDAILREYAGDRHVYYKEALQKHSVIAIWGRSGRGKTWAAAKIAIGWQGSPGAGPRQAMWFECQSDTGLQELICGIAHYLRTQGAPFLWDWAQALPLDRPLPAPQAIAHLVNLLNQRPYLLCFDDFHRVDPEREEVRQLFTELYRGLHRSKVILIGQQKPPFRVGSRRLQNPTQSDVRDLAMKLGQSYQVAWLTIELADEFAQKLINLVGYNLKLIEVLAIDWLESNASAPEARSYLENLSRQKVAEAVLGQNDVQATTLLILSALETWVDKTILSQLSDGKINRIELQEALDELAEARLISHRRADGNLEYRVHDAVREQSLLGLAEQTERWRRILRRAGDLFLKMGKAADVGGTLCWQAAHHYREAEAYGAALQVLSDHALDLIGVGKAEGALKLLEQMLQTLREREQEGLLTQRHWLWVYILRSRLNDWLGRLAVAKSAAERGLVELQRSGAGDFRHEEGHLRARLGIVLAREGHLEEAIQHLMESYAVFQDYVNAAETPTERIRRNYELITILDNIGLAHLELSDGQQGQDRAQSINTAIGCFERLLSYARAEGEDPRSISCAARALVRLGQSYNDLGQLRDAEKCHRLALRKVNEGLKLFERLGHRWGVGFASDELGRIYLGHGQYTQAINAYQQSLEIAREFDDKEGIVLDHIALGELDIITRAPNDPAPSLANAAGHLEAAQRILAGKPEFDQDDARAGEPVELPFLAISLDAFQRWLRGVELLSEDRSSVEGAENLDTALATLRQEGCDDVAKLVEKDLAAFGLEIPASRN